MKKSELKKILTLLKTTEKELQAQGSKSASLTKAINHLEQGVKVYWVVGGSGKIKKVKNASLSSFLTMARKDVDKACFALIEKGLLKHTADGRGYELTEKGLSEGHTQKQKEGRTPEIRYHRCVIQHLPRELVRYDLLVEVDSCA